MPEKKIVPKKKKEINIRDLTTCEATIQMLEKAKVDGVETAWDRAGSMKACPIGATFSKRSLGKSIETGGQYSGIPTF